MKFYGCEIDVSQKVLVPRIETEFWVKKIIKEIKKGKSVKSIKVLDIFAGTGCIGISVLKNLENSKVDFIDISSEAIKQIKINLDLNKVEKQRYNIYQSDMFPSVSRLLYRTKVRRQKKYDFIFANPPYVAINRIKEVDPNILKKEPFEALFSGQDGMKTIKKFLSQVKSHLKNRGQVFMEFDSAQKPEIERILKKQGFTSEFKKDQFEKYRYVVSTF